MKFKNLENSPAKNLKGYSDFLDRIEGATYLAENPSFEVELLAYSIANNQLNLVQR